MPISLGAGDIAVRLALAVVAGALFGVERGEHGRPAGLRTTLLVCLAAAVAMLQTNLLLGTAGRPTDSFVTLDLMRLPLGILTGMGFIGGGAILHRQEMVLGVTTAATLWFVTVIGLCFGGGQLALGAAATGLGIVVVWALKGIDKRLPQDRRSTLVLMAKASGPDEEEIRGTLLAAEFRIASCAVTHAVAEQRREFRCDVRWRGRQGETRTPVFLDGLARHPGVLQLEWQP